MIGTTTMKTTTATSTSIHLNAITSALTIRVAGETGKGTEGAP